MEFIENGGVTTPKGFTANGMHCGIRKNQSKKDLALIFAQNRCPAAAVYTQNLVKGAPITVTKQHLSDGYAQAMICNSGNANTCNADGVEKAELTCNQLAQQLQIQPQDVIVASTGVIGQPLNVETIVNAIPQLVSGLSTTGSHAASEAIMTTDTQNKEFAVTVDLSGKAVTIGGIAKGSGMIHPNMATMLAFLTTDAAISPKALQQALTLSVSNTYNMLSIDGDTSTNDMACIMASGLAGNAEIQDTQNEDFQKFVEALTALNTRMVRAMARDGEGATKMIECTIEGAKDEPTAKRIALSVVSSSLVKAAMFGADANWGRVLCAIGYSGCEVDVHQVSVDFVSKTGHIGVCRKGAGIDFDEQIAKEVLSDDEITIQVQLQDGTARAAAFGCDLTYDYVKINGDYRT